MIQSCRRSELDELIVGIALNMGCDSHDLSMASFPVLILSICFLLINILVILLCTGKKKDDDALSDGDGGGEEYDTRSEAGSRSSTSSFSSSDMGSRSPSSGEDIGMFNGMLLPVISVI